MRSTTHAASALFRITHHAPIHGHPDFANLRIESNRALSDELVRGPGLYAIHFRGRLLYIGKFLGTKKAPCAGRVCLTRWAKHMGTLTLRDRRLSLSPGTIQKLRGGSIEASPIAELIAPLPFTTLTDDRGRHGTFNRVLFAHEHWAQFHAAATAAALLDGFEITYTQAPTNLELSIEQIRQAVGAAENATVDKLCPRCNAQITVGQARDASIEATCTEMERQLRLHLRDAKAAGLGRQPLREHAAPPAAEQEGEGDPGGGEEMTAEEMLSEKIGDFPAAVEAFETLANSLAARPDAYLWYTRTAGGDFRVRSTAARPGTFFNVAAVQWQPRLRQFKAEIYLAPQDCLNLGATAAQGNYADKTLGTIATFGIPGAAQALIDCLLRAADRHRDEQQIGTVAR